MSTPQPRPANSPERSPDEDGVGSETLFNELDALLQRMLALPVESTPPPPEEPAEFPEGPVEVVPLITVAEAGPLNFLPESTAPPAPAIPPTRVQDEVFESLGRQSPPRVRPPSTQPAPLAPSRALSMPPSPPPRPAVVVEKPAPPPPEPEPQPSAEDSIEAIELGEPPAWFWPIVWVNNVYDRLTVPFGRPGRWFRIGAGRSLVGWAGLLMLLSAGGLVAWGCWLEWTW